MLRQLLGRLFHINMLILIQHFIEEKLFVDRFDAAKVRVLVVIPIDHLHVLDTIDDLDVPIHAPLELTLTWRPRLC